jgi:hypothetical protein
VKTSIIKVLTRSILCLAPLGLALPSQAAVIHTASFNGHTYYLLDNKTWLNQEAEAVTLGGHIVTINDAAENTWVWDTFGALNTGLFIGLNDAALEGNFVWSSGEAVTYLPWRAGEPNGLTTENFGELGQDYKWNDVGPNHTWRAVVEVVPAGSELPEPATSAMFLAGLGLMGFMTRRRKTS